MTSTTANLSSEDLRRVRQELWSNLQDIDTRLKQTYVPPHFRITTSSTNNQRTFSTIDHQISSSSNDTTSNPKRSRISSSSYDEHNNSSSLAENNFDESSSTSKSLHSSIVPTNKIIKTKDDLISLVNRDQQSTNRNRRMFGVLLGTLNKFKAEANAYNEQTNGLKRHEIERRLEEKQAKEREDKQHERTELLATKKTCQQKLKLVNIKLEIMQRMANHEKIYLPLKNFIRTKTKPYIFYLPKNGQIDEIFEKKFQDSQNDIDKEIEDFKRDCQQELNLLDDDNNNNNNDDDEQTINSNKKRKLNHTDNEEEDEEEEDDVDDTLADLPDEITLSAPEIKSEIVNTTINSTNNSTRIVIYDETKNYNQQNDQSTIDE